MVLLFWINSKKNVIWNLFFMHRILSNFSYLVHQLVVSTYFLKLARYESRKRLPYQSIAVELRNFLWNKNSIVSICFYPFNQNTYQGSNSWIMDSNRMTANNLDENPRIQHIANTTKTNSDFEPAAFITPPGLTETVSILKRR